MEDQLTAGRGGIQGLLNTAEAYAFGLNFLNYIN